MKNESMISVFMSTAETGLIRQVGICLTGSNSQVGCESEAEAGNAPPQDIQRVVERLLG